MAGIRVAFFKVFLFAPHAQTTNLYEMRDAMAKAEKGKEETKVMTPWRQFFEIARMERENGSHVR